MFSFSCQTLYPHKDVVPVAGNALLELLGVMMGQGLKLFSRHHPCEIWWRVQVGAGTVAFPSSALTARLSLHH